MTERTDIHRPGAIVPDDYVEVGYDYLGADAVMMQVVAFERARVRAHMERSGGRYATHQHGGTCHVCGAWATYLVVWQHVPTNEYIKTGEDCASAMFRSQGEAFNRFRRAVHDAREAIAGKRKAQATLADLGMSEAWQYHDYVGEDRDKQLVRDVVGGLVRYGSWSEKQVLFVAKLLLRIADAPRVAAERAARDAARADCPSGRVIVEGVVLSTKTQESNFSRFGILKMLVEHDSGYKVWGTVPDVLLGGEQPLKGARVRFTATVTPKTGERSFGFFKRPTKAEVIRYAEVT